MKKLLLASAAGVLIAGAAGAEEIKMGISLGFTGPLESMAPAMRDGAELAMKEISDSGLLLDGSTVTPVEGDSTCADAAAATATVERLITAEKVKGIVGGMCSGETIASLENVAKPNGIVMISPSATSPALSTIEDNDLFFRTSPSDARQGEVMSDIILDRGIKNVAVTYTNNDYGKGLADSFQAAFEKKGGTVTVNSAHDDGKADYSAEVAALAAAGGDALVVAGYVDQGGSGIVRAALDTGAFDTFVFPDGMVGQQLVDNFKSEIDGSFGQNPAAEGEGRDKYVAMAKEAGFDGTGAFSAEAYDAASLMLLAMAAAKSSDPAEYKGKIMDVANAPGEKILPGELAKALEILNGGGDIDYVGATSVELVGAGESAGIYREVTFDGGKMEVVGYR
ncbi:MAG: ABC transporter substrate-binding protein [Paracoccus sp. (in: a-proteobacteria)]|uniref:ABC transporter substrate-binding protein n=1 Tax=unclassified Paracoccus (in: a-proteobacteria) TaxID=2688777 RepID=UPI000C5403AC|nr:MULTISPECIES: ABC transporter substrate-binding protein [unclassified Paracoccus (in: a-proteobacteria)]MAN55387.1 branched-chain amino acid ABC transporter substrate-binding protein [Paracoccus sp. (in: a-proteobacteria)]MBA48437.1 branched-chain amino acid ABC transporter substrate-binding protein [Paracoccus sp. (in: a-proteobacteria)]MCS5601946.1 ABC transporter substrate-binding protein [Paracoccus sp. (in: a-proteobacteria)]HIC64584.1 branched-chain amino acid ABC transporter substrate|tara:strand:+ start:7933 stop:9117 length:1185 start_codon:yes stop_codon:yes gene_type:complete